MIELRFDEIAQLFHTLDPFPFRERDLDREAEDFIVGWARELPVDQPISIVIRFPDSVAQTNARRSLSIGLFCFSCVLRCRAFRWRVLKWVPV